MPTLRPMPATSAGHLPRGEEWTHEVKRDGYRTVAIKQLARETAVAQSQISTRGGPVRSPIAGTFWFRCHRRREGADCHESNSRAVFSNRACSRGFCDLQPGALAIVAALVLRHPRPDASQFVVPAKNSVPVGEIELAGGDR